MILELAIGDAYGAGFEYVSDKIVRNENRLDGYRRHPRHAIGGGRYTDDTQMTLAIAEAMLEEEWTVEGLGARFVQVFHRDPREGYAGRFYDFLQSVKTGEEFLQKIVPRSDKSGAAMRAVPIGLYGTIEEVVEKCELQASITHDTTNGRNAAVAVSLMSHFFRYRLGKKEDLPEFLVSQVRGDWTTPWFGKVKSKGWMSVRAALTAILTHDSLSEILRASIAYTGDVDTVATIALGCASLSEEIENDIPDILLEGLECGPDGRAYLERLDRQLLS